MSKSWLDRKSADDQRAKELKKLNEALSRKGREGGGSSSKSKSTAKD